jgi:hypothetical protein
LSHRLALQYANEITNAYEHAEDFSIPAEADDRLRDIVEPLFAIATVADSKKRYTDAMVEAALALAGLRIEHDADDAAMVAGPKVHSKQLHDRTVPIWSFHRAVL